MKIRISIAFIFGLLLLAGCSSPAWDSAEPAQFTEATELIDSYKFAGAESLFTQLAAEDSTKAWGNFGLGLSQERQLQWWDAAEYYSKVLATDRSFAPALVGMGRVYSNLGWFEKSVGAFQEAVLLGYDLPRTQTLLAQAWLVGYETKTAREVMNASNVEPAVKLWIEALSYRMEGSLDQATAAAKGALAIYTDNEAENALAADYYEAVGRLDSATTYSVRAVEAGGFTPAATTAHFARLLSYEDFDLIRQFFPKISKTANTEMLLTKMQLDYHTARSELISIHRVNRKYQILKEQTSGGETFGGLIVNAQIKSGMADMYGTETTITKIDQLESSISNSPIMADLVADEKVRLFTLVRGAKKLLHEITMAATTRTGEPDFDLLKMMIEVAAGDYDSYNKSAQAYLKLHAESPAALTRLSDMLSREFVAYVEDAIKYYNLALEKNTDFQPAFENLINLLMKLRRFEEANTLFENYPVFAKQSGLLRAIGAICLAEAGSESESLAEFKSAMSSLGGNVLLVERELRALWTRGNKDLSLELIETLVTSQAGNAEALSIGAQWSAEYGESKRALELATKSSLMPFTTISSKIQKARALYLTGQKKNGYALFEELGASNQSDPELSLYHSQALARDKKTPRKTANLARGSLTINRHTLYAFLNICEVYFSQKRYDLALGQARQAVKLFPDQPRAYYYMGLAADNEKRDEAIGAFEQAIKLGLSGERLKRANQILESK